MSKAVAAQSVLITGAGRGIGRGLALRFAAAGWSVLATDLHEPTVMATAARIKESGRTARGLVCDVTLTTDIENAVKVCVEDFGGIDSIVHNAVAAENAKPHDLLDEDSEHRWEAEVSVGVRAARRLGQRALPYLKERNGSVVLFSSSSGLEGRPYNPAYAAGKAAMRGFAKSAAKEWGGFGVRVNCVVPMAATEATTTAFENIPTRLAHLMEITPLARMGDPYDDIAPPVVFLAGDDARFITGQTLVVSGGMYVGL